MSFPSKVNVFIFFLVLLFAACDRENIDNIIPEDPGFEPIEVGQNDLLGRLSARSPEGLDLGCIQISYPFDLVTESGLTISINSEADFDAALEVPSPDPVVDFVYPLAITDSNGDQLQVEDILSLSTQFASCIPDTGWDNTTSTGGDVIPAFLFEELCLDLVYPVDLEDGDGFTYTAANEAELLDLIVTKPNLVFTLPMTVTDEDGGEVIIESAAGFFDLYYSCDGITPPGTEGGIVIDFSDLNSTDCDFEDLSIQFPYEIITDDGESITVEDENQEAALILSGVHYTVLYPFNLVDEDGMVIPINNDLEFIELILPCLITVEPTDPCDTEAHVLLFFNALNIFTINKYEYQINFPVTLIVEGNQVVVNNGDEYLPAVGGSPFNLLETEIVYPVTITQFGQEIVLNSDDDVCQFYQTLDEPCENKPAHIQFFFNEGGGTPVDCAYFITYPLDITLAGITIQVQTREDYLDQLNGSPTAIDEIELVYPVSINQFNSGQQIFFQSDDDVCAYLDSCM